MAETEKLRKDADICLSDIKDETENKKKKEKEPRIPKVGPIELFKFADKIDVTLIIFGTLTSIGHGVIMPVMCALFGEMTDNFADHTALAEYNTTLFNSTSINHNVTLGDFMSKFAIYYSILGAIVIVTAFAEIAFFTLSAGRQVRRIRIRCFHSILRQDIGWFDVTETGTLNTHIIDDVYKIQEGIGEQIGLFIQSLSTFVFSFVVSLIKGWKLTLVILAVCPLLGLTAALFSQMVTSFTTKEQAAYAKAGAVAEEVLSAIRTVFAFNGQHKEINRYHNNLEEAKKMGIKATISTSLIMGFTFMMIYLSYALAFWYGSTLILTQEYSVGTVLSVLFALLIGASALGHTSPAIQSFSGARGAAYKIYSIIANKPTIDSYSESGFKPDSINGNLEFKNVHFTYPSRPDVKVLNNLSLSVKTGQTVALVGSSGCGKSTTIQLLQRFYELQEGSISIDGHDICSLNVRYLRGIIGVVSQEPVLFATTISENIRYGRLDVTQEEIEAAAKEANAYDFIVSLPDKFETLVGDRGTQMSGGQKQRIAIARALVRNPKILLLDEATSALDAQSETIVQAALDKVRLGRTTIVVAHRLSTIRNADVIAGFKNGEVVEFGTHSELMEKQGVYHTLVTMQTFEKAKDEEQEESVPIENCPIAQKPVESSLIMRKSTRGSSNAGLEGKKEEKETLVDAKNIIDDDGSLPPVSFCTIMRFNLGEWPYILFGTIFAILNGIVMPMFEIILSKYIVVFIDPDEEVVRNKSLILSIIFAVLGVASFFTLFLEGFCFGKSGEILTMKMRLATFTAMMRQDLKWYDDPNNSVGALTTRLALDAAQVQGATGVRLSTLVHNIVNMSTCLIIAFMYGWQLTLLVLLLVPFMIAAGIMQMQIIGGQAAEDKIELENAGKILTEAIENIRTVASLTREPMFETFYADNLQVPYINSQKRACLQGLVFSITEAILCFAYAACFRFGAWLIENGYMDLEGVFTVTMVLLYGAMNIGETNSYTPSYAKAKVSAAHIIKLLNRQPAIDNLSQEGQSLDQFDGNVQLEGVRFTYPSRPNVLVLQGLNLKVGKGETLALVGSSGCGKSTTIQLLERFYDPVRGNVMLDSVNAKELNIHWLRSQIGIVSQEPVLFDCSLAENIAYGDNSRTVTMEEIKEAAEAANIHSFIENLPKKYDTQAGDKGTQLSGGQKQRIAIARAIIRNPKLLLLDEATSALDTESEKVVQEALDKARAGRTCIVVAHRLSTIQNADCIAVFKAGVVVEQGTHQQLLAKKGVYHMLVTTQLGHEKE